MKKLILIFFLLTFTMILSGYEMNTLIENPTAGILQRGEAEISAKLFKNNGLIMGTRIGLFPRFMFGVSYGAERIVGNQDPVWHDRVEFNAKFRLIDETAKFPAVAIGYDSQGHGTYYKDAKRYDMKSKGFYLAASKNYLFLGNLGFHGGVNYSLETEDDDDDINLFAGIDKSIGDVVVLLAEYDVAWNDNEDPDSESEIDDKIKGLGKGYFNASFDIHFTDYLVVKFSFYDIFENREDTQGSDRTISLLYYMKF
ncbi:MAG: YjbH domain-containing protein [Candidatus Cloacimonetes bacterium]|nr:YjbH domain-containing protein [Candidatus Cloacimonadota bacterium]